MWSMRLREQERVKAKDRVAVRLEREQVERLTVLAGSEKRTFADMLRLLLSEALEARKK